MTYDIQIHIRYTHMLGSFFMSVCLCLLSVHCANHARSRKMFVTLFSFQLLYSNVICHFHASFSGQIGTTDCQEAIKNIICRSLLCGWFNFQFRLFSTFFSVCSHRCSALLFFLLYLRWVEKKAESRLIRSLWLRYIRRRHKNKKKIHKNNRADERRKF